MGHESGLPERLPESLQRAFPNLTNYVVTSPRDPSYNCIAFAAGDTTKKWDPGMLPDPGYYWPPGAFRQDENDDIEALKRAFMEIGYEECTSGDLEIGFQKVAMYAITADDWLHAAIQLSTGEWSCKLGNSFDIRHPTPQCVEGPAYGTVMCFMKRSKA